MAKREVEPQVVDDYIHVDRRAELIRKLEGENPGLIYSFKDPNKASARELDRHRMKIVHEDDLRGKDAPHEPVRVDNDLLVCQKRQPVIDERIRREKVSEERVKQSMRNRRNLDGQKWKPSSLQRKPKDPKEVGVPVN